MAQRIELQVPFAGFYESIHDDAVERALEDIDEWTGESHAQNFSYSIKNMRQYVKSYLTRFESRLPCEDKFTNFHVISPKEYNFETDKVFAELHVSTLRTIFSEIKSQDEKGFRQRVAGELESRSGFVPFYSADLDDWGDDPAEWESAQLELMVRYYMELTHDNDDDWEFSIVEEMRANGECDLLD